MFPIEADIQDTSVVIFHASNWSPICLTIPHDTGKVRGASDHELIVILEAQDRSHVIYGRLRRIWLELELGRELLSKRTEAVTFWQGRQSNGDAPRRRYAQNFNAFVSTGVPYADCPVARAG